MKTFFKTHKLALLVITAFAITGAAILGASFAATTTTKVTGRVYDTRTSAGIAGVKIEGCTSHGTPHSATTGSDGKWSFVINVGDYYCARSSYAKPSGWTGPVTKNLPQYPTMKTYEYQVAGMNCYHVTTNATCNASAQNYDRSVDTGVDFLYTSPTPAPPQTPPASTPPTTSKPTTTTPKKTTTSTNKTKTTTNSSTGSNGADTSSPTAPQNLVAKIDSTTKSVHITWQASTDNVGVVKYQLERSAGDQQNWQLIGDNVTQTSYDDLTAGFASTYYYRLKAVDAAGNVSDYAATQVDTGAFEANTSPGSQISLTSDDKVVTVTIPAGSLNQDASCSVTQSTAQLPSASKYVLVSGPYELSCRDSSGNTITTFNKPLVLSAHVDSSSLNGVKQIIYQGQNDDSSWHNLKVTKHDKSASTDTVNLDNYRVFSIMGAKKKTPAWVKILEVLAILVALLFLARFIVRKLLVRKAEDEYDEYLRKAKGL